MKENWSDIEDECIVSDYFEMLEKELKGIKYSKTEHRRKLYLLLSGRSEGSVEFKHQNISAVLCDMGIPFIKGYKPRFNYQGLLADKIANRISKNLPLFEPIFESFANTAPKVENGYDFTKVHEPPPKTNEIKNLEISFTPTKVNYLELEQKNSILGSMGEEFVLNFEKWRLLKSGKSNLAEKVKWISKDYGDGAGFDILSKNDNGSDLYIEVKTTKLTKDTPVFITKRELQFSEKNSSNFRLYRVFDFSNNPRLFVKSGRIDSYCRMFPENYKGFFY